MGLIDLALGNSLKPDFPPPRVDAAGAKHTLATIPRSAVNALEHDGWRSQVSHFASLLVDEIFNASLDAIDLPAIGHMLSVKGEAAIEHTIQRRQNLLVGFYPHQFARLQVKIASGRWLPCRNESLASRIWNASPQGLDSIIKPAGGAADTAPIRQSAVVGKIEEATKYSAQRRVA
jgi:hypothetical protein